MLKSFISVLFAWYMMLTVLALTSATTLSVGDVFGGLVLMWIMFLLFASGNILGARMNYSINIEEKPILIRLKPLTLLTVLSLCCSIYATHYYTGKWPSEVAVSLALGQSLYSDYQAFNIDEGLTTFTMQQIPAFLSIIYVKLWVILLAISVSTHTEITMKTRVLIIISAIAYLYHSVARGTSFELLELSMLLWFCMSVASTRVSVPNRYRFRKWALLIIAGLGAVTLFYFNLSSRYMIVESISDCSTAQLCFNDDSYLSAISPGLARLSFYLSGYFTFGIYFTSQVLYNLLGSGGHDFFYYLLAPELVLDGPIRTRFCGQIVDCGVAWIPDIIKYIDTFGFLILMPLTLVFGFCVAVIIRTTQRSSETMHLALLFFCFLICISSPVGNFVSITEVNILLTICLITYFLFFRRFKLVIVSQRTSKLKDFFKLVVSKAMSSDKVLAKK